MEDKITLKGNGSFYIREGWLTKGLVEIEKNPELFSKKYFEGADALGVGSVMAKSIKYWLMAAGLIVKKAEPHYLQAARLPLTPALSFFP